MLSIGAGYQFPQKLHIDETFNTSITTTFDNGDQFFEDTPSKFSYKIIRPQRIRLGATLKDINGFNFSASLENIMYSNARIEFDELVLNPEENDINTVVRSSFEDVINLRLGIEYRENKQFSPRVGYGYFPSPQEGIDQSRQFLNGGFSAELTQGLIFDFGLQYSFWEDENTIYTTPTTSETVQEDVTRLHVMTGIRMMM
jgi:long-subunit fatty acid transport protein